MTCQWITAGRKTPCRVSDRRLVDTAGLAMYRHKRFSLSRSLALVATPACSENPATLPTVSLNGLSGLQSGRGCRVNTLRFWWWDTREKSPARTGVGELRFGAVCLTGVLTRSSGFDRIQTIKQ